MQQKLNVCFISPHPDDIEIYCGGALLAHASNNDNLTVIMMTHGERGAINPFLRGPKLASIRKREAEARYAEIETLELIFAQFKDGQLISNRSTVSCLANLLIPLKLDIIYIPEFNQKLSERKHKDHINAGQIINKASRMLQRPLRLRCYHSKVINNYMDISPYYAQNNKALLFYKSQQGCSINSFLFGLSAHRFRYNKKRQSWGKEIGCDYAEGFRELCIS